MKNSELPKREFIKAHTCKHIYTIMMTVTCFPGTHSSKGNKGRKKQRGQDHCQDLDAAYQIWNRIPMFKWQLNFKVACYPYIQYVHVTLHWEMEIVRNGKDFLDNRCPLTYLCVCTLKAIWKMGWPFGSEQLEIWVEV